MTEHCALRTQQERHKEGIDLFDQNGSRVCPNLGVDNVGVVLVERELPNPVTVGDREVSLAEHNLLDGSSRVIVGHVREDVVEDFGRKRREAESRWW